MASSTTKRQVLDTVEKMPDDATIEDVMERLYLLLKVNRGLKQVEEGKTIPHDEAKKQIKTWHE